MAEEKKIEEENWDEPIDYPYFSARNIMFRVIEYIEARYKSPDKDVLKTDSPLLYFQNDDLVVLASKPHMGKTAFVLGLISQFVLEKKISVGLAVPVLSEHDIGMRLLSIDTEVPVHKIRSGMLKVDDVKKIQKSANKFFDSPFFLFYEPNCSFKAIRKNAIEMAMENHIQLLIVDDFEYLQDIVDCDEKNYRIELSTLLSEFKRLAVELHIPIILVMDIPESENDNEPTLSDFNKYMIIPDKADKLLFLHKGRFQKYTKIQNAKLIIAKNNSGPKKDIPLDYYRRIEKFSWRHSE